MTLTDQVIPLALAKRLKELEVKQESLFFWYDDHDGIFPDYEEYAREYGHDEGKVCSAFTVAELGEMFPGNANGWKFLNQKGLMGNLYYCTAVELKDSRDAVQFEGDTEAEARGRMLVYLLENNLMRV